MKVLIVGCGAVGQVYGLCLQKAGVELGLNDQPAVVERLRQAQGQGGLPLFQITRAHRQDPLPRQLQNYQVLANPAECRRFQPDQIWFATPSMVYYTRAFQDFVQQVPSQRVVCFAPEGRRPEFLPGISPERLVFGGTTFLAWQGDLQGGGGRKEGINFWLTPLGIQLSGTKAACRPVQQLLQQAGFRTAAAGPDSTMQAVVTAGMTAFVAGLELSGWSLRGYRRGPWLASAARAAREAVLGELPAAGRSSAALLGTPLFRAGFSLAARTLPRLFPFDLEKYLRFHYSKTHDQTLTLLSIFLSDANSRGLPAADLQHLREALARPGSPRL